MDSLDDPMSLPDAPEAVSRIRSAIERGEMIRVFGDYDCDGITSTALVVGVLGRLGARVDYRIPSRMREGYGLSEAAVREASSDGVDLLVTVDCGVGSHHEVEIARSLGVDVVITDHHEIVGEPPSALAVVNPKRADSEYAFRDLAGVGVAHRLMVALAGEDLLDELDLVALGTVADAAPLIGENRILVRTGIEGIRSAPRTAFSALAEVAKFSVEAVDGDALAMTIGPRINAPGRLGNATALVEFMMTDEPARAAGIARACEKANDRRKELGEELVADVDARIGADPDFESRAFLVLWGGDWHPGILGPAASRVAERYRRPVALLAPAPDDPRVYRGSARTVGDFDLLAAVESASGLLEGYGGHVAAAGLTVRRDRLEELAGVLDHTARDSIRARDVLPGLDLVGELPLAAVDRGSVEELSRLGPFGQANPRPLFFAPGVEVGKARPVGTGGRHLIIEMAHRGLQGIGFNLGDLWRSLDSKREVDLAFTPEIDNWRGADRVRLRLESLRPVRTRDEGLLVAALRGRWREVAARYPTADTVALVLEGIHGSSRGEGAEAGRFFDPEGSRARTIMDALEMDRGMLLRSLAILQEAGAVAPMKRGDSELWLLLPGAEEPLELEEAVRYRRGRGLLDRIERAAARPGDVPAEEMVEILYGFRPGSDGGVFDHDIGGNSTNGGA